jgi:fructose-specific PTS system IIA-like component
VIDFFSIGTNDLCQYYLAVDRGNQQVSDLFNERHPSFIRLLKNIVDRAHEHGKRVGMCGEMARSVENLPLLIGLGLDEISLASPNIPAIKAAIAGLKQTECRKILDSAMECSSPIKVSTILSESFSITTEQPLVGTDMIVVNSDSRSKAEAIKELADLLYIVGRTDNPDQLEEAIWAREAVYSTGLGYGFAIPHCKTDSICANSLGILKLTHPIDWNSIDDKPTEFVILLAVRESDQNNSHMRIFSQLARKLVSDEFRESLLNARDSRSILLNLTKELDL